MKYFEVRNEIQSTLLKTYILHFCQLRPTYLDWLQWKWFRLPKVESFSVVVQYVCAMLVLYGIMYIPSRVYNAVALCFD